MNDEARNRNAGSGEAIRRVLVNTLPTLLVTCVVGLFSLCIYVVQFDTRFDSFAREFGELRAEFLAFRKGGDRYSLRRGEHTEGRIGKAERELSENGRADRQLRERVVTYQAATIKEDAQRDRAIERLRRQIERLQDNRRDRAS